MNETYQDLEGYPERYSMEYPTGLRINLEDRDPTQWEPCTCNCHQNPAMKHIMPCCDNGWVRRKSFLKLWAEWWGKTTNIYMQKIDTEANKPLSVMYMEEGRKFFNEGKTPEEYADYFIDKNNFIRKQPLAKYFIPDISDIRVGYEYEWRGDCPDNLHWRLAKMRDIGSTWNAGCRLYDINEILEYELIRVPYLTKEQIEAEFKIIGESGGKLIFMYKEMKDSPVLIYNFQERRLYTSGLGMKCQDINTLRYICKLL